MAKRIAIIQGHPDPSTTHFCHALAETYEAAAGKAGHEVRRITVAALDFPVLQTKAEFDAGTPPPDIAQCQSDIAWADHLVVIYPLWLGTMPALLKGFLEQVYRPGFAFEARPGQRWARGLRGRSARIVVTMGMPAFVYRWYFGAHSLKSLERNVLRFVGIKPVRTTVIGSVESSAAKRAQWLEKMRAYGAAAG